ncbi:hypothetical protein niasHT_012401 [Heterodera trifolii]|uniref:Uncharacterized protein n=1 Tax=Heterodera trifolii TaxID=157864 RepID=A0ABD2L7D8_9BILA
MNLFLLAFFTHFCIIINANEPVEEVRVTCELLGDEVALPKKEMKAAIEKLLYERIKQNDDVQQSLSASITLFHTFCQNNGKHKTALETIGKIVKKVIEHPNEEKFFRIRMDSKTIKNKRNLKNQRGKFGGLPDNRTVDNRTVGQSDSEDNRTEVDNRTVDKPTEKVLPVKGAIEFLGAIGFRMQKSEPAVMQLPDGTSATVISNEPNALEQLENGMPIQLKTIRNAKVIKVENLKFYNQRIPNGFYKIRVQFPSGYVLQGIFDEQETLANVNAFVAEHLEKDVVDPLQKIGGVFNLTPNDFPRNSKFGTIRILQPKKNSRHAYGLDKSAGMVMYDSPNKQQVIVVKDENQQEVRFPTHPNGANEADVKELGQQLGNALTNHGEGTPMQHVPSFRDAHLLQKEKLQNFNQSAPKGYCQIRVQFPSGYVLLASDINNCDKFFV